MKKRNLIIAALTLVASVSVASVLMMLSAQSGMANNVVMMSNGIDAKLVETDDPDDLVWKDAENNEITLQYPHRMPGDIVTKKPRVERIDKSPESAINAYVAVKVQLLALQRDEISDEAKLSESEKEYGLINFTIPTDIEKLDKILTHAKETGLTPYNYTTENVIELYETILNGIYYKTQDSIPSISPEWTFCKEALKTGSIQNQYNDTGWFFYVNATENGSPRTLKPLPPLDETKNHAVTDVIFTNIAIPNNLSPEQLELYSVLAHANIELYLKFTAYLAQSDNSPYKSGTTFEDYKQAFPQITSWLSQEGIK